MKIAHIFWGLCTGGVETMLVNIANEQSKMENCVHVVIINDLVDVTVLGKLSPDVHFICLKRKVGTKNPWFIGLLNGYLLKKQPDVIHFHEVKLINYVLPIWRTRSVFTLHHLPGKESHSKCKFYKKVYAISDSVREELKLYHRIESKTIFNGIPTHSFKCREKKKEISHFVQVGRLLHQTKGQDILIEAFSQLIKCGYRNLSLTFIGEGESEKYLKELAEKYKVESYVHFTGLKSQDWLFEHLADYDLFVQPSRFEGFGLTVAEAMAAKVPVLVSDNQGPIEVIAQGKYGYSFRNGDVEDCVNKLKQIISNGIDFNMIDNAYKYVTQRFDVSMTAKRYIEEYKTII